ncbi:MAG: hypothetical protein ABJN04_03840 [Hyphomicrobiales bacterium]
MKWFFLLIAFFSAFLIGGSFAGNIHRSFDALAMVRPALCIGCLLGVFVARKPLPIDLAFSPSGGSTQKRPLLGSDHSGLVADLGL